MKGDPEYRKLLEKHGVTMGMINAGVLTRDQVNTKKHELEEAIAEIERRERQGRKSFKEAKLNQEMRLMMFDTNGGRGSV